MNKQFIVVAYDISDNKRRTRLHKRLQDFGTPVQYSVFECLLENKEFDKMKAMVKRTIKPRLDHVRFYVLCNACRKRVEVTGNRKIVSETEVIVV